jgi:hypothetical protein
MKLNNLIKISHFLPFNDLLQRGRSEETLFWGQVQITLMMDWQILVFYPEPEARDKIY